MTDRHGIPSMTAAVVLESLTKLGATWRVGLAVECGSWLGATCAALAAGLVRAGYDRPIHCFDQWRATWSEVRKAGEAGVRIEPGQNLEPLFRANVTPTYPDLVTHRGPIQGAKWTGEPIAFFLLDGAKTEPAFSATLRTFGPSWVPGLTVVGLLDYFYWQKQIGPRLREHYRNQARFVETHEDSFRLMRGWYGLSSAIFRYEAPIDWSTVSPDLVSTP